MDVVPPHTVWFEAAPQRAGISGSICMSVLKQQCISCSGQEQNWSLNHWNRSLISTDKSASYDGHSGPTFIRAQMKRRWCRSRVLYQTNSEHILQCDRIDSQKHDHHSQTDKGLARRYEVDCNHTEFKYNPDQLCLAVVLINTRCGCGSSSRT